MPGGKGNINGSDNTNGFQKNPQNINRSGANANSISHILKTLGEENIISYELITTNSEGKEKIHKGTLKSKDTLNTTLSIILFQKALKGDLKAIREILDRTEGKPNQYMNTDNTEKIIIEFD